MGRNSKKALSGAASPVLGGEAFAAMTAVEGMTLSASSKKRLLSMAARKLSPAEKRAEILRTYAPAKSR